MKLGLEGRDELKYAMPVARREELLAVAWPHVLAGAHTHPLASELGALPGDAAYPASGYRVHSLYLDSPRLDGYGRRLAEADIRNRLRVRTYGRPKEAAPVYLEAKRKLHEKVVKHRVMVGSSHGWSRGDEVEPWATAVAALPPGQARRLAERWVAAARQLAPLPSCITHYVREVYEQGEARLTLDHQVRGSRAVDPRRFKGPGDVALLPDDWMVLELKFNGVMPGWMRALVRAMRLNSEPVSKFALATVRTLRSDRAIELEYLTPPSVLRAGRGFLVAEPRAAVAR